MPGPVITKCVQEPGCWKWDPCCCRCVYCPGPCKQCQIQCPPVKVCKKVWVPEVQERQINCVKYVREMCVKTMQLHGLQDGAGATREDLHATRSATWCPSNA